MNIFLEIKIEKITQTILFYILKKGYRMNQVLGYITSSIILKQEQPFSILDIKKELPKEIKKSFKNKNDLDIYLSRKLENMSKIGLLRKNFDLFFVVKRKMEAKP